MQEGERIALPDSKLIGKANSQHSVKRVSYRKSTGQGNPVSSWLFLEVHENP